MLNSTLDVKDQRWGCRGSAPGISAGDQRRGCRGSAQGVPGIGAGAILVFILAIGYYITPELVGGTEGTFISNRIAYHISGSLNWGLGAALGVILLGVVVALYLIYDKIIGIDNMKLG